MLEVLLALAIVLVTAFYFWKGSTAILRSAVNLPPLPGQAAPQQPAAVPKKKKKAQQSEILLRQEQPRDTLVLFGTTTGTSWQFAEQLVREGQARFKLTMRSQSLEDYDFESELHLESAVVVIVPTYEGGTPNATTKDLFNYLHESVDDFRTSKALFERVSFAVFGLGDTAYGDNFAIVGRKIDDCLQALGGNRMLARGSGDAQYASKQFETWMGRLWPSLLAALGEKELLAKLRADMKARKANSAFKAAAYVSDDEDNEDKEPLADVEDLGAQAKGKKEEADDDDESSADEDVTEIGPGGEGRKELLTPALTAALSKQGYQLIGTHSGVKLCRWTKAMLRGRGGCYKHTFYNIASYQCMEMTPSLACANKCVFCVAAGTPVNLGAGMALPIEQFEKMRNLRVLALDASGTGVSAQTATEFMNRGARACIELVLRDGRSLVCTPDHRVRTERGWVEAAQLAVGDEVACGVEFALGSLEEDPSWRGSFNGFELSTRSVAHYFKAMAACRLLGYAFAGSSATFLGQKMDAENARADAELVTGRRSYAPLAPFATANVSGVLHVPSFLSASNCPAGLVREFLGGLFGACGVMVSAAGDFKAASVELVVACEAGMCEKQAEQFRSELLPLLARCGVEVDGAKIRTGEMENVNANSSVALVLPVEATASFASRVGFRYSGEMQIRLATAVAFGRSEKLSLRLSAQSFEELSLPIFYVALAEKRDAGVREVYDLSVPLNGVADGSFMAGGIVVHNCWRHGKNPVAREWKWQMDQPEFLIEQSIIKHQNMIRECKGVPGVIPERLVEAMTVRHCALSLVGEPIIYPQINRFVDLLHERKISSFMVTNAQFPKELEMLKPVTQVYLSIDAATRESLKAVDRPVHPDFWERFLASIDVLRNKKQRTVFRLTLVKEWNMNEMRDYAQLIERGMPEFIEVKGVTYCGNNKTSSLTIKNTPYHEEVCAFVQQLADEANKLVGEGTYRLCAAHEHSVCFLLAHKKFFIDNAWHTFIDYERFHVLVQSGKPFESLDYVAKTPSWALFGSAEKGFDPEETRVFRKGKEGKRDLMYATSGC